MIFFSKRDDAARQSSNMEACVSILGLILAVGLVGGLTVLIYGLVKGSSSGTIGGGVVLGVSVVGSIILALIFIYCLKNNNVDSNENGQRSSTNQRHHHHQKQHRHVNHDPSSSHEITVISGVNKYNRYPQQKPNRYDTRKFSPPQSSGLADSTNFGYGKQLPQSPSKTSSFPFLNQSNSSMNVQSSLYANTLRNNYNRY